MNKAFLYKSYTKIVTDAYDVYNGYNANADCSWLFFN